MKNRHFEQRRSLARQYHRNKRGDRFEQGILVRHDYSGTDPGGLSWWDDLQFVLGRMRVSVSWQHPRQVYKDLIESAAMDAVWHLYEQIEGGLFSNAEKNYQKIGRSRKKIFSYTTQHRPGEREWLDALRAEQSRLSREAAFSVAPSIKVHLLAWCRYVEIIAPIEVRNVEELRALADRVRRILKRESVLDREFPGYVYGREEWIAEGLAAEQNPFAISHRAAGT